MDRARFQLLLNAYGADLDRWPAEERAAGAAYAAKHEGEIASALDEEQELDTALDLVRNAPDTTLLAARILRARADTRPLVDNRAALALAACAVFGVILGYGGGLLAPVADEDAAYFSAAFEAPFVFGVGDE